MKKQGGDSGSEWFSRRSSYDRLPVTPCSGNIRTNDHRNRFIFPISTMVPIENSVKIMVFKVQWNRKLLFDYTDINGNWAV